MGNGPSTTTQQSTGKRAIDVTGLSEEAVREVEKQEVAKHVNAMLRDLGLLHQSPNGEPVPLRVNPGGERNQNGVFIVGQGKGSVSTRYPEVSLMPALPKKPRGE
jgi:hypothetical protein